MATSLSNLMNNLKYKYGHSDRKCKIDGIKSKYRDFFLEYTNFKDDLIEHNCLCCNRNYRQKLKERFFNT